MKYDDELDAAREYYVDDLINQANETERRRLEEKGRLLKLRIARELDKKSPPTEVKGDYTL